MNNLQTQTKPEDRIGTLLATQSIKNKFNEILGKQTAAFMSSILSVVNGNKALKDCEPMSIISAAATAATFNLPINPNLGQAHIVPYKGIATFQMGWKGFVQLGMRSGQYRTMNAVEIYEGQITKHDPFTGAMEFQETKTSDKIVGYLFYFKLINGFEKYTYWTREKCEKHGKRYSASFKKNFGQWVDNFDAMALKTVVKEGLSKWGVLSIEMQEAMKYDQAAVGEDGSATYVDGEEAATAPEAPKQSRIAALIDSQAVPPAPETTEPAPTKEGPI